jgi:hypothetical protein
MSHAATSFLLRHPMSERTWKAGLIVELVDPVSGLLVHRDIGVRVLLAGDAMVLPAAVTASGRFVFRKIAPDEPAMLLVMPREAPFLPERVEVPPAAAPLTRQIRVVLVPHRAYVFPPGDAVIHQRLLAKDRPAAGVGVAVEDGAGILAAPARTDDDGEFVLHLRAPSRRGRPNGTARPATVEPMPPGLEAAVARPAASERRLGLVFTRGSERRRLPAEAGPALPIRGLVRPAGPGDVIRWEDLVPMELPPPEPPSPALSGMKPRRGARG